VPGKVAGLNALHKLLSYSVDTPYAGEGVNAAVALCSLPFILSLITTTVFTYIL